MNVKRAVSLSILVCAFATTTLHAQGDAGKPSSQAAEKKAAEKEAAEKKTGPAAPSTGRPETDLLLEKIRKQQREMFRELLQAADANADKLLGADELDDRRKGLFQFERDGDGLLSEREFLEARSGAYMELLGRLSRETWTAGDMEFRMGHYMARDKDADNALSAREAPELFATDADADSNGKVTFRELMEHWESNPAERLISELDLNGDGRLSQQEVPEVAWAHSQVDRDGDGNYIRGELVKHFARTARSEKFKGQIAMLFARFDADGDGSIAGEELPAVTGRYEGVDGNKDSKVTLSELTDAVWLVQEKRSSLGPEWAKLLTNDRNQDLALTADEVKDFANYAREVDRNKDGVIAIHEIISFDRRSRKKPVTGLNFGLFDRDRDGKITKKEYPGFFKEKLNIDADKDGIITEAEFNKHFKKKS